MAVGLAAAALLAPLQLGAGDLLGRTVAHNQAAKLAALEGQYASERGAGLSLGSLPVPGRDRAVLDVRVPKLGTIARAGGERQVTYNGHPLYTYAGDTKAGATTR